MKSETIDGIPLNSGIYYEPRDYVSHKFRAGTRKTRRKSSVIKFKILSFLYILAIIRECWNLRGFLNYLLKIEEIKKRYIFIYSKF